MKATNISVNIGGKSLDLGQGEVFLDLDKLHGTYERLKQEPEFKVHVPYQPPPQFAGTFNLGSYLGVQCATFTASGNAKQRRRRIRQWKSQGYTVYQWIGPGSRNVKER